MPFIKFVRDYTVQDDTGTTHGTGDVLECSEASANHFIHRLAAVLCEPVETKEEKPEPKRKPAPKKKEDDE